MANGKSKKTENFADQLLNGVLNNTKADGVNELLDKFGLNWQVNKVGLLLPGGIETDFFGVVREDTNTVFQTCKESYTPFQNSSLADLVLTIADKTGFKLSRGGMFNGGGRVYLQLETGVEKGIGQNKDQIKKYITGINSHDGTRSLRWGPANTTISCSNTFNAAYSELRNTARHTENIAKIVEQSLKQIDGVQAAEKSVVETFGKMAEVKMKKVHLEDIVLQTLDVDLQLSKKDLEENYTTYRLNQLNELLACINGETKQKGETLWGLFSGVTKYTTHQMPAPKRENGRLESKYVGGAFDIDNNVFELIKQDFLS